MRRLAALARKRPLPSTHRTMVAVADDLALVCVDLPLIGSALGRPIENASGANRTGGIGFDAVAGTGGRRAEVHHDR